jgi:hypothetical protein
MQGDGEQQQEIGSGGNKRRTGGRTEETVVN